MLAGSVPRQLVDSRVSRITLQLSEAAEATLNNVMLASAVTNLIFSGFMSHLFAVLNSLQLLLHLPLFAVVVPSNVASTFGVLVPVVMYDMLSDFTDPMYRSWWPQPTLEEFKQTLALDQVSDLGYTSFNPIINLGTLAFLMVCYLAKIFFTVTILWPLGFKFGIARRFFI